MYRQFNISNDNDKPTIMKGQTTKPTTTPTYLNSVNKVLINYFKLKAETTGKGEELYGVPKNINLI